MARRQTRKSKAASPARKPGKKSKKAAGRKQAGKGKPASAARKETSKSKRTKQSGQAGRPAGRHVGRHIRDGRHLADGTDQGGECLWKYENPHWVLVKAECRPGYEPSDPPPRKGDFVGHYVRTLCRPKRRK
jgi:hypothetical protein